MSFIPAPRLGSSYLGSCVTESPALVNREGLLLAGTLVGPTLPLGSSGILGCVCPVPGKPWEQRGCSRLPVPLPFHEAQAVDKLWENASLGAQAPPHAPPTLITETPIGSVPESLQL